MPTGCTNDLYYGQQTLAQFLLGCSRAFTPLISIRDESGMASIPATVQPSPFYENELKRTRRERARIAKLTDEQAENRALREWRTSKKVRERHIIEMNDMRWRYEQMLRKVQAWSPPTPDHVGMKEFAIQQLKSSIRSDLYAVEPLAQQLDGAEWQEQQLKALDQNIARLEQRCAEEIENATHNTLWIQHLLVSLGIEFSDEDTIPVT